MQPGVDKESVDAVFGAGNLMHIVYYICRWVEWTCGKGRFADFSFIIERFDVVIQVVTVVGFRPDRCSPCLDHLRPSSSDNERKVLLSFVLRYNLRTLIP